MQGQTGAHAAFFRSFVPPSIVLDAGLPETRGERAGLHTIGFPAAVAFVDLARFTETSETYERLGPQGVEVLSAELNRVFGGMIDAIIEGGGEVVSLPGDAVVAYWRAPDHAALPTVARRAAGCLQTLLRDQAAQELSAGGRTQFRAGLACGDVDLSQTGRGDGERHWFLSGAPVDAAIRQSDAAAVGTLGVADGTEPSVDVPLALPPRQPEATTDLVHYVHPALRQRILAGQQAWLDELRVVTSVFVSCEPIDPSAEATPEDAHAAAVAVKAALDLYGGALQSVGLEKGRTVCFGVFGLPGLARDDDATRCVTAAMAICDAVSSAGYAVKAAITTGPAFCGVIGTDRWRTFSVRGSVINRAARIVAAARSGVTIDAATRAAAGRVVTRDAAPLSLKGLADPVPVFTVESLVPQRTVAETSSVRAVLGRATEMNRLVAELDRLGFAGRPGNAHAMIVEGVPGIGKSALLQATLQAAADRGFRVLRSDFDGGSVAPVYAGWVGPLRQILGLRDTDGPDDMAAAIAQQDLDETDQVALATLLGIAPASDETAPPHFRTIDGLALELLRRTATVQPVALLLDDCERLDTASLRIAQGVLDLNVPVLLLMGVRTEREAAAIPIAEMLTSPRASLLVLDELSTEAASGIVAERLGASTVAPSLAETLHRQAAGNPLFIQELAQWLLERGSVAVTSGHAALADGVQNLDENALPGTVEHAIVSRVDRLDVEAQMTLKTASVIGRRFTPGDVTAIHPQALPHARCKAQIDDLSTKRLTPAQPDGLYTFLHAAVHRAVYGLLPFSARRDLHAGAAEYLETTPDTGAAGADPAKLADHWLLAEKPARARPHLVQAGTRAMMASADPEARRHFTRALEIGEATGEDIDDARLLFSLGEVEMRLGDEAACRTRFTAGLARLGERWPTSRIGIATAISREAMRQVGRRWRGGPLRIDRGRDARALAVSRGLQKFGYLFYFEQSLEEMSLAILATLNRAEDAGVPADIRRACGQIMLTLDVAGLKKWADAYAGHATDGLGETGEAEVRSHLGLHALNRGDWSAARDHLARALTGAREIGDKRLEMDAVVFQRSLETLLGDYRAAQDLAETHFHIAEATADMQHRCYARVAKAELALRLGRRAEARAWLEEGRQFLLPGFVDDELMLFGPLAEILLMEGQSTEAWRIARAQLSNILDRPCFGYYATDALACVCWVLVDLAHREAPPPGISARETAKAAREAVKAMDAMARRFAPAEPRAAAIRARALASSGRTDAALGAARTAVDRAEALGMRFDKAVALFELSRIRSNASSLDLPERKDAERLLADLGLSATGFGAALS